jgi:two-component system, cell cycle response regulator
MNKPNDTSLKLLVKGFNPMERRLLDGAVMLSQRRAPRIELVADHDAASADVVMIDALDAAAVHWAAMQPWLARKPAIWAGAKAVRAEHTMIDRHVKWPILPVLLYRAIEQAQGAAMPAAGTAQPQRSRRVLVVDDSLAARKHLRALAERMNVEVDEASTAEEGIELAATHGFGCVFMDVLMPGVDGFEACRRIKAKRAQLPIVMLTSKSSPFDRVRGKIAGCDTYLVKPVDPAQLNDVLARHLGVRDTGVRRSGFGALAPTLQPSP